MASLDGWSEVRAVAVGPSGAVALDASGTRGSHSADGVRWLPFETVGPERRSVAATADGFVAVGPQTVTATAAAPVLPPDLAALAAAPDGWTAGPDMAAGLVHPSAAEFADAEVYLFSEAPGGKLRVDRYDAAERTWSRHGMIAAGMRRPRAALGPRDLIYIVGITPDGTQGRHILYDPQNRSLLELPPMPTPRLDPGVEVGRDRKLYVFGGRRIGPGGRRGAALATVERSDLVSRRWSRRAAMPVAAESPGVVSDRSGSRMLVFEPRRVWTYDTSRDRWRAGPAAPALGIDGSPTFGADGQVRVFGCDRYDIYDPRGRRWLPGRLLGTPRCDPIAVPGAGKEILTLGGTSADVPNLAVESVFGGIGWRVRRHWARLGVMGGG